MNLLPIPEGFENTPKVGDRFWFEYHCWESHDSKDAKLWYHSHQQCEVLGMIPNAGVDCDIRSQIERFEIGHQIVYRCRFDDGFEWDVFEDELLDDKSDFERPDPPNKEPNLAENLYLCQ